MNTEDTLTRGCAVPGDSADIVPTLKSASQKLHPRTVGLPLLFGFLLLTETVAQGQSYVIDRYSIEGGGGQSAGGVYSVDGTIGQFDAGQLSGGIYILSGGFWDSAGQVSAIASLGIAFSQGNVILSWPNPSTGFQLQQSLSLGMRSAWSDVNQIPSVVGERKQVSLPATSGKQFFRLQQR